MEAPSPRIDHSLPRLEVETPGPPAEKVEGARPAIGDETPLPSASSVPASLAGAVYFAVQRLRAGADAELVRRTTHLLDSSRETLRAHVEGRLRAMYGADGDPVAWLQRQPVLERTEVDDPAWERSWIRRFRRLERKQTSGSTGQPVRLCKDMEMASRIDATMWALYSWHGIRPGMRHARFWGLSRRKVRRAKKRAMDRTLRRRSLGAAELSDQAALAFFDRLRRFQPVYLHGYPSLVDDFVRVAQENGCDGRELGARVAFLTGEVLFDEVRERIGRFLDARVVSEYGCSESGLLAFGCEKDRVHEVPSAALMELLSDGGDVQDTGAGEVLVTDLFGKHRPLLRYRLRDRVGRLPQGDCECGRHLPLVEIQAGRLSSPVLLPDGRRTFSSVISHAMPRGVRRFQARQVSPARITLRVEASHEDAGEALRQEVRRRVGNALGGGIAVEVTLVDRVPRTSSGKHRYFIPMERSGTWTGR